EGGTGLRGEERGVLLGGMEAGEGVCPTVAPGRGVEQLSVMGAAEVLDGGALALVHGPVGEEAGVGVEMEDGADALGLGGAWRAAFERVESKIGQSLAEPLGNGQGPVFCQEMLHDPETERAESKIGQSLAEPLGNGQGPVFCQEMSHDPETR